MKFIEVEISDNYEFEQFNGNKIMINLSLVCSIQPLESSNARIWFGTKRGDCFIINYKYSELKELISDNSMYRH